MGSGGLFLLIPTFTTNDPDGQAKYFSPVEHRRFLRRRLSPGKNHGQQRRTSAPTKTYALRSREKPALRISTIRPSTGSCLIEAKVQCKTAAEATVIFAAPVVEVTNAPFRNAMKRVWRVIMLPSGSIIHRREAQEKAPCGKSGGGSRLIEFSYSWILLGGVI